nr:hypothetical protein CFP56_46798 [Quercus suber]
MNLTLLDRSGESIPTSLHAHHRYIHHLHITEMSRRLHFHRQYDKVLSTMLSRSCLLLSKVSVVPAGFCSMASPIFESIHFLHPISLRIHPIRYIFRAYSPHVAALLPSTLLINHFRSIPYTLCPGSLQDELCLCAFDFSFRLRIRKTTRTQSHSTVRPRFRLLHFRSAESLTDRGGVLAL